MSVNKVIILGNLGADPEIKYLPDSRAVANFSVACGERWKDKNTGEQKEHTEWVRVVCFGRRAEVIGEYFKKGNAIFIEGKMRTHKYEKDGVTHYATEVVADNFDFCGSRNDGGEQGQQPAPQRKSAPTQQNQAPQQSGSPYDSFDDEIPF